MNVAGFGNDGRNHEPRNQETFNSKKRPGNRLFSGAFRKESSPVDL